MRSRVAIVIMMLLAAAVARAESDDKDELLQKDPTRVPAVVAGEAAVDVTVKANKPPAVAGLTLRVLRKTTTPDEWAWVQSDEKFDGKGVSRVQLSRGAYVFEVLGVVEQKHVVAVHSEQVTIGGGGGGGGGKTVELVVGDARPVTATLGAAPVRVEQFAVRGFESIAEARWDAGENKASTIALVTRPGEAPNVSVIGRAGTATVALWEKAAAASGPVRIAADEAKLNACRFNVAGGGQRAVVRMTFPDASECGFSVGPDTRFLTNRRYLSMSYRLERGGAAAGEKRVLSFRRRPYVLAREQTLALGGALKPAASVTTMFQMNKGPFIVWDALLLDGGGHELDFRASEPAPQARATLDGGAPVTKNILADWPKKGGEREKLPGRVRVTLTWDDGTRAAPHKQTLTPALTPVFRSPNFSLHGVPAEREDRARVYLAKLERLLEIERQLTGRRGPAHVKVEMHAGRGGGFGAVPRKPDGARPWMRIAHAQFTNDDDPLANPPTVFHELLHNFGYPHGEEMYRIQFLARTVFARGRGDAAEDPAFVLKLPAVKREGTVTDE